MTAPLSPEQIAQLRANDHDTLRVPLIVGHVVCLFVAVVSVALRFWVRRIVKTSFGADDYVITGGLLLTAAYVALNLEMIQSHQMGRHIWWLDDPMTYVKLVLVAEIFYIMAMPFIKCSILLLYRRIFPQQWLKWALLGLGLFVAASCLAQALADIFQCTPIDSLWGASPKKYCINFPVLIKVGGTLTILTDVATLALPLPSLWRLNLSATRKRLLIVMFLIGGIACIVSIVRLFFVNKVGNSQDSTWDVAIPALISTVELSVGVLAACLPTYRPLFTRITGRIGNTIRGTSQKVGLYLPVKDSIQIPISSHFTKHGVSNPDLDDMEMLAGKTDNKMQTHITTADRMWHGPHNNEIRVTTSFKTSSS